MNVERAPTPKRMLLSEITYLSMRGASPVDQTGGALFFRLFFLSLSRKASNATIKLPKDISRANIPMKIEMIS